MFPRYYLIFRTSKVSSIIFLQEFALSAAGLYCVCFSIFFSYLHLACIAKFDKTFAPAAGLYFRDLELIAFIPSSGQYYAAFGTVLFSLLQLTCNFVILVFFASPAIHFLLQFVSACKGPVPLCFRFFFSSQCIYG